MLIDRIEELLKEVSEASASNAEEIEQLRLKYLSKKGEINALMNDFRTVAAKTDGYGAYQQPTRADGKCRQY